MLALWFRSSALESSLPTPWTCSAGFRPAFQHGNIRLSQVPELSLWCMPCSKIPVVSRSLAITLRGLLPSDRSTRRLWLRCSGVILLSTTIHISGFNNTACILFGPASHLSLRKRTRASLPTCRLGFGRVGLEQTTALSPTG